jgi:hypothetical protein
MTFSMLLAIDAAFLLIACVLYVVFGQVTVRSLRKNPKTRDSLGLDLIGGWDIINVAQALALPKSWAETLSKSPIGTIYAERQTLMENTNKFDRFLACIFYWTLSIAGMAAPILLILNYFGVIS